MASSSFFRHLPETKANSAAKRKIYSMVEMNPESSISGSNSLETKTPDSMTPSVTKDDLPNASKESNATVSLAVCLPGQLTPPVLLAARIALQKFPREQNNVICECPQAPHWRIQ